MTTGYFHYRKPSQALTVYYEIYPSDGILKYSCSLWRQGEQEVVKTLKDGTSVTCTMPEIWMRKDENAHAKANFEKEFVTHTFPAFEQGDLKLDDVWLKKYIHKHICKYGRKRNLFLSNDIQTKAYKTVGQCYSSRGHEIPEWINPETGLPKLIPCENDEEKRELVDLVDRMSCSQDEGFLEQLVKWWYS